MAYLQYAYALLTAEKEEGQGMVEYGLIIALVAVVAAVALTTVGTKVSVLFNGLTF